MNPALLKTDNKYLRRTRYTITKEKNNIIFIDSKPLLNFCSNDYLNISMHKDVKKAFSRAASNYGLGSGASALISGYSTAHAKLEEAFAAFLNRDRALLFNSGYHANLGIITSFANRKTTIIADKYCHASLNDGAILSRARYYRYRHQDMKHAKELLLKYPHSNKLLVTESIFSMQGDLTDIKALCYLAKEYKAMLIVDDAHGVGILGETGRGISEHLTLSEDDIKILITPFGKALGSMGAIVSGSQEMIETLLQQSRTYRYSTAIPPAICEATLAALHVVRNETWRREKLKSLSQFFIKEAKERSIPLVSHHFTPIKSICLKSNQIAVNLQKELIQKGLFISCIRPPTVPHNTACARISINCMHEESQIIYLLEQIQNYVVPRK